MVKISALKHVLIARNMRFTEKMFRQIFFVSQCPDRFKRHLFGEGILYFRSFLLQSTDIKLTNILKYQLNILFTLNRQKIPREREVHRTLKIFVTTSPLYSLKICVRWRKRILYAFIRFSFSKSFEWYIMIICK